MTTFESDRRRRFDALFARYADESPPGGEAQAGHGGRRPNRALRRRHVGTWTYTVSYGELGASPAPAAQEHARPLRP